MFYQLEGWCAITTIINAFALHPSVGCETIYVPLILSDRDS